MRTTKHFLKILFQNPTTHAFCIIISHFLGIYLKLQHIDLLLLKHIDFIILISSGMKTALHYRPKSGHVFLLIKYCLLYSVTCSCQTQSFKVLT